MKQNNDLILIERYPPYMEEIFSLIKSKSKRSRLLGCAVTKKIDARDGDGKDWRTYEESRRTVVGLSDDGDRLDHLFFAFLSALVQGAAEMGSGCPA